MRQMHWMRTGMSRGAADIEASQKREFEHADFRVFWYFLQIIPFAARVREEEINPYKDFSSITILYNICTHTLRVLTYYVHMFSLSLHSCCETN